MGPTCLVPPLPNMGNYTKFNNQFQRIQLKLKLLYYNYMLVSYLY
uniref:Uncharacterized protein n=1 Tax=Picea glauca TaxID=3330 RepID=A0A101LW20_PICGL|nr:hypothetical protein ABT39_MTgene1506 [Picea glauca]